jgi:hypothetical protein
MELKVQKPEENKLARSIQIAPNDYFRTLEEKTTTFPSITQTQR